MPNQNALTKRAAGLFNNINNFETPPGSLTVADNVKIDKPNLIEKRPGFDSCSTGLPAGLPLQMFTAQSTLFTHIGNLLWVKDENCTYSQIKGPIGDVVAPKSLQINGNTLYVLENVYGTSTYSVRSINLSTNNIVTVKSGLNIPNMESFLVDGNNMYYSSQYTVLAVLHVEVRVIDLTTAVDTLVAGGVSGYANGTGSAAQFTSISGITQDTANLYVMAYDSLRKVVKATGVVTTIAGNGTPGNVDGTGGAARLLSYGLTNIGDDHYTLQYTFSTFGSTAQPRKINITTGVVTRFNFASQIPLYLNNTSMPSDLAINYDTLFTMKYPIPTTGGPDGVYQILRLGFLPGGSTVVSGPDGTRQPLPALPGYVDGDNYFQAKFNYLPSSGSDGDFTAGRRLAAAFNYIYVPDRMNNAIRLVNISTGQTSTLIGGNAISTSTDGNFSMTTLMGPS